VIEIMWKKTSECLGQRWLTPKCCEGGEREEKEENNL